MKVSVYSVVSVVKKHCLCYLLGLFAVVLPLSAQQSYEQWLQQDQQALQQYQAEVTEQYNRFLKEEAEAYRVFLEEAGRIWGDQNIWQPQTKRWVQYTENLDERSAVHFEDGIAEVEIIIEQGMSEQDVTRLLANGVENLVLSGTLDPIEMIRKRLFPSRTGDKKEPDPGPPLASSRRQEKPSAAKPSLIATQTATQTARYTVQRGDTLWGLSKRFGVSRQLIAEANRIDPDGWLKIGQQLIIPGQKSTVPQTAAAARETVSVSAPPSAKAPLLEHQVAMPDGTQVTRHNARQFAEAQVAASAVQHKKVTGTDNVQRDVVAVVFPLVPDHLRVRAERFRPAVSKYAAMHGVYPPLVYAIIHSESSFNPRARSHVPAYGLMQLVPRSGARDAYLFLYKQDRLLNDTYLYDAERNIELGVAYLHILDQRYFRRVENPMNRMLCAIAGYNTGAGNVCKAFDAGTSLTRAAPVINAMTPEQVYNRLRSNLPYEETRNYIVKVNERISLYREWQ